MTTNGPTAQAATSPLPTNLFGYNVLERLGEGAASTIYAVSDPKTGQLYALKHVVRRTEKDLRFIQQVQTEYAISRNFKHPGLRRYYDLKINRTLFRSIIDAALVMELVDGAPLDQQKPGEIPAVMDCFIRVAQALNALHLLQYVHCDLKPNNIMLDARGGVKVIDFGQACKVGTVKQRIQGTPDFIAPEQVKLKPVTIQTDVFNLGATLYWALSGHRIPTLYTVPRDQREIVLESKFASPRDLDPTIPRALSDLVMECVHVNPLWRPANMDEIAKRLIDIRTRPEP